MVLLGGLIMFFVPIGPIVFAPAHGRCSGPC